MENLTVAELIEALNFVGRVLRNKDGSKPADAITKIIKQLNPESNLTLARWAEGIESRSNALAKKAQTPPADQDKVREAMTRLENVRTQGALRAETGNIKLSPAEWRELAKKITGKPAKSGRAALAMVETYFSNRLLLQDRVESVERSFY
jgi:hypothetical protein